MRISDWSSDVCSSDLTAQKRSQTLIDVPQSVSVISGDLLEQQHAPGFADYLKNVPNLQLVQGTPGQGRLVLRGVNTCGVASTVPGCTYQHPFGSSKAMAKGPDQARHLARVAAGFRE